ncbi:MAG TPA: signal peptide peptidase SppA [Candidatus Acidoferrales bacterium]|nr:signal peptide peptidase SppA [Candidatus Acidoferrales bacterium]
MLRFVSRAIRLIYWHVSEIALRLLGRRPAYGLLRLQISGDLPEQLPPFRLPWMSGRNREEYLTLLTVLRWARDDEHIRGVFIRCNDVHAGWAKIQEVRRSLQALRAAGKRVWIFLPQAGLHEYLLASVAERIILAPSGSLDINGLSSEATFFAQALDKIGVDAEVVQLGKYKSAGESFTRADMSPEHRQMMESLIGDLYEQIVEAVAEARNLAVQRARELLDGGPLLAQQAQRDGLVDALQYEDQAEMDLRKLLGDAPAIEFGDYHVRRARAARRTALRQRLATIGLVQIVGTIKMGESIVGPDGASATGFDSIVRDLATLRERDDIGAVVMRVASPGGSGLASDLMWRELQRIRERKPLVVSFGDVAASGGYYVGVTGSPVLAEGGTITGSIGVVAGKAVLRRLYDRLGVTKEIVGRSRYPGLTSDYVPLGDDERQLLQAQAAHFYEDFVEKVAAGRALSQGSVETVAQGRVWTGRQALQVGLVDQLGGLQNAIEEAKLLLGMHVATPVALETYPKPRPFWRLPGLPLSRLSIAQSWLEFATSERIWAILPIRLRFF